jgi:hypothetical protein
MKQVFNKSLLLCVTLMCALGNFTARLHAATPLGSGSEFEIGGWGNEPGRFRQLRDLDFDGRNRLRTLEGFYAQDGANDRTEAVGNRRIQKFSASGAPESIISLEGREAQS